MKTPDKKFLTTQRDALDRVTAVLEHALTEGIGTQDTRRIRKEIARASRAANALSKWLSNN